MAGAALILASASPRRKILLEQIGVTPDAIVPANIDETPHRAELPRIYAARVAREKAQKIATEKGGAYILAADTVVACGRRILPKAEERQEALDCLQLISGRAHRVYSGVCLATPDGKLIERLVETRVKVRLLDKPAIEEYLDSDEWAGKAGGYAIQGLFAKHVISIIGSHANVVGLPVYETWNMLTGAGWRP